MGLEWNSGGTRVGLSGTRVGARVCANRSDNSRRLREERATNTGKETIMGHSGYSGSLELWWVIRAIVGH